jgi:hypothetical protein
LLSSRPVNNDARPFTGEHVTRLPNEHDEDRAELHGIVSEASRHPTDIRLRNSAEWVMQGRRSLMINPAARSFRLKQLGKTINSELEAKISIGMREGPIRPTEQYA